MSELWLPISRRPHFKRMNWQTRKRELTYVHCGWLQCRWNWKQRGHAVLQGQTRWNRMSPKRPWLNAAYNLIRALVEIRPLGDVYELTYVHSHVFICYRSFLSVTLWSTMSWLHGIKQFKRKVYRLSLFIDLLIYLIIYDNSPKCIDKR